ncbi:pyridoxamine 5'-phosphate oxidase family protein [Eggerthellaceae bacterium 24-137]
MSQGKETIVAYLTSIPAWYLATVEETPEGPRPHVRPFSFAAMQDGDIQFCTATTKDVYREMQANPFVELTAWKPGHGWVIMRGRANLADTASEAVRREGYDHMIGLGESYTGPDDPELTFFTIADAEAWLCDIDGSWNPVKL